MNGGQSVQHGRTPLHFAAQNNDVETVESLLKQGTNVNVKDYDRFTPLHLAAWANAVATTEVLLKYDADVNAKSIYGWTPLHFAAQKNAVRNSAAVGWRKSCSSRDPISRSTRRTTVERHRCTSRRGTMRLRW